MKQILGTVTSETRETFSAGVDVVLENVFRAKNAVDSSRAETLHALGQARAGQFSAVRQLGPFALALGLLAITVGAVAIVLAEMKGQVNDSIAQGVLQDGLTAMSDFGGWFGILVIMGVITIIFLFLGVIRRAGAVSQE